MALGDLHIFNGEEYVDTELAPLLNENFDSLKDYIDEGYWKPNEVVTVNTVRKLVGDEYAGCFLICRTAGTTGSVQPLPNPTNGSGFGDSITFYSSLEEIGITPGQESFASIHSALPINSVLEYYAYPNSNFNDEFYPVTNYYGVLQAVKLNGTKTIFSFYAHNVISSNEFSELYLSAYDSGLSDSRTPVWKKVALDSDLTNLSNSVVKSVNGIKPTNGNVNITGVPTGTILPFAGNTIPSGFLACNGAAVSRTTYSALFSAIGTTYGGGDGSSTFNVPQIEDNRFLEFSSTRGSKCNAGLPNITGTFNMQGFNEVANSSNYSVSGAFYMQSSTKWVGRGGGGASRGIAFDASRSNGLYGDSNTVQPKSLTVRAIIKY